MTTATEIDLQKFDQQTFVDNFGSLYERSPWIAEQTWNTLKNQRSTTLEALAAQLKSVVDNASKNKKLILLRAHPELAGKAATEGKLTSESTDEQSSARLDLCSLAEFRRFQELNTKYNQKFNFPFILAVRNRSRADILSKFESRLNNSAADEFNNALEQVHQIARLRIAAMSMATVYGEMSKLDGK